MQQQQQTQSLGLKGLKMSRFSRKSELLQAVDAAKQGGRGEKQQVGGQSHSKFYPANPITQKEKKLPKNFANKVLDFELKLDSGRFDLETIDKLMQLYSQAVEFYSGQNDEKYMYFTERIQNTLLRPEILKLIRHQNSPNKSQREELEKQQKDQMEKEKSMTHGERMKLRQVEHEQRKKARVQKLEENSVVEDLLNPQTKKDREFILNEKLKTEKTIQLIKNDQLSQKNSIESRIAERKRRLEMKRSAVLAQGDLDASISSTSQPKQWLQSRPQPVTVRHSNLHEKRGFVPLISQEDLEKEDGQSVAEEVGEGLQGANCVTGAEIGNSTLDDVVINNNFISPNISGINSNNTSGTSPNRKVNRSRKNIMSQDMNDLSAIYQQM